MAESKELKMEITRILTPEEENGGYDVKEKEPFVNFESEFRNLHSFPMEPKVRGLIFQAIHMNLPYRNRISRFLRNGRQRCSFCFEIVDDGLDHEFVKCKENKRNFSVCF